MEPVGVSMRSCYLCNSAAVEPVPIPVLWVERNMTMMQWACSTCADRAGVLQEPR